MVRVNANLNRRAHADTMPYMSDIQADLLARLYMTRE